MQKLLLASLLALLAASTSFAQNVAWVKSIGNTGVDKAVSTTIDQVGNVYTCGHFIKQSDFDPGPGVFPLYAYDEDVY